ncbi:MAG: hypothetical protein J6D37_06975 [Clostridia bacterium]|nr:hypothetical protein [Clostridia bacterium]
MFWFGKRRENNGIKSGELARISIPERVEYGIENTCLNPKRIKELMKMVKERQRG